MLPIPFINRYDHRYVVTVPGGRDRQEHCVKELGEGSFEFVYSVDKSECTKPSFAESGVYDETRGKHFHRHNKGMTLGHICCSIGHRNVYQRMVDDGVQMAMIFEDDVTVLVDDETAVQAAIDNIPPDAEMVYWGWAMGEHVPWYAFLKQGLYKFYHAVGALKYNDVMIDNLYSRPYNGHFRVAGKHVCAHAYTLTLSGAKKLIEINTPIAINADNAIQHLIMNGELRGYISNRQFFGQRSLDAGDPMTSMTGE